VTSWVDRSASGWIDRFRRSDHMPAQACKRRRSSATGRTGLHAGPWLAPEGCWFESNRGSPKNSPDLHKQVRRVCSSLALSPAIHTFAALLTHPWAFLSTADEQQAVPA